MSIADLKKKIKGDPVAKATKVVRSLKKQESRNMKLEDAQRLLDNIKEIGNNYTITSSLLGNTLTSIELPTEIMEILDDMRDRITEYEIKMLQLEDDVSDIIRDLGT